MQNSEPPAELTALESLNLETGKISWKELELYFAKGILLRVNNKSDLIKIAETIALNDTRKLEEIILNKEIEFVTSGWVKDNCSGNPDLWAVVVAPYVVCQLIKTTE